jgi:hypothetical protein
VEDEANSDKLSKMIKGITKRKRKQLVKTHRPDEKQITKLSKMMEVLEEVEGELICNKLKQSMPYLQNANFHTDL